MGNMFSLAYLLFIIIWIPFPTMLPVTGPILLAAILGGITDWVISGHKRFEFPIVRYISEN